MGVLILGLIFVALAGFAYHKAVNKSNETFCTPFAWVIVGIALIALSACAVFSFAQQLFSFSF